MGRGLLQGVAHLQARYHHLDGNHCVINQQAKSDDQRTQRNTLQRNSGIRHHNERDGENQRNCYGDNKTGSQSKTDEADSENNDHRLEQRLGEA